MSSSQRDPVPGSNANDEANTVRDRDWPREYWALQCRLAETQHSLRQARSEIDRMLESRSWKATRFMRWGLDGLRRFLRPHSGGIAPPMLRSADGFAPPPARSALPLLMVDVTELAIENLQGGIQHTVKGILSEWLLSAPAGWQVVPVQLTREGFYVSASQELEHLFGAFDDPWRGRHIATREGDVFLGLDLVRDHAEMFREALGRLKSRGVQVDVVIYDLLPIDLAHCVPAHINRSFAEWLNVVGDLADGAICISQTVASRFSAWLSSRDGRNSGISIVSFSLGVPAISGSSRDRPAVKGDKADFLMVGTIEPRKGYVDALDAFDRIWSASPGSNITLTIVGRYGWGLEAFLKRLETHPELGRRLRWLKSATDDEVHARYEAADGLLFSSYGEGFGLPIIEAAQHHLPMILRDLPEFREVAGDGAFFFAGEGGVGIELALHNWLQLKQEGRVPRPRSDIAITWQQSADLLLSAMNAATGRG